MKNFILISLLIIFCQNLLSQEYVPFDFKNGIWVCKEAYFGEEGFTYGIQFYTKGDTIINGNLYQKLHQFRIKSDFYYMYPDTSQGYYGAIRNNSNKQVEYVNQDDTIPEIIYDFNLNLGDTIKNGYGKYEEHKLIVMSIDSVNYCGKYHKRYNLNDTSIYNPNYSTLINQSLIEGIGFNSGLINPWFHQFEVETRLVCYTEKNNDYCEPCDLLSSIKPINTKNSIKIYPNPSLGKINIDVENIDANKQFEIKIIDLSGKIIYKKTCKTKSLQIDMSNQSSGIYNAIITTKNNIYCKQFVKQ
ncbi:MAG: hypothetical protein DRJ01_06600 [Bacteroidetes bacterium]|nr:MAG: hypothetical protein DRJ01_06600 [Bacteroidota bacterium]